MKTAISIPNDVFAQAEQVAKQLSLSRSQLYATAIKQFVDTHSDQKITEQLNRVYQTQSSTLEPALAEMQFATLQAALKDDQW